MSFTCMYISFVHYTLSQQMVMVMQMLECLDQMATLARSWLEEDSTKPSNCFMLGLNMNAHRAMQGTVPGTSN